MPLLIALAAGFAVAHTQSPPFFSNQNQYLLHGLAHAGYGHLDHDWLATTTDPTPLFSAGVAVGYRVAGLGSVQVAYFVLLMGYFLAAWWLVSALPGIVPSDRVLLGFTALFTVAHAAVPRLASVWLTGADYPWYLQAGVAGQYVLGPGLQPSAFGVLLVASVAAFANGRPRLAAVLGAGACLFHATYLLPAALFTAGYMIGLVREGRTRTALQVGAVALAVVLPVVVYTLVTFRATGPKQFGTAQSILAEVRIPHHTDINKWFDVVAALQVGWVAVGIALLRRTRLFVPLLVAACGGVVLTLAQVAITAADGDRHTLALLFPWRVSVVLVPVATAVVAAKVAGVLSRYRLAVWVVVALFLALVVGGVVVTERGLGYRMDESEEPLLNWVHDHVGPDDVYLIPTRIPPVGAGKRGIPSNTFMPPTRAKDGSNQIPVDLQRFRLATGAPIYADFKSIPYAGAEVLKWYRRVNQVETWYAEADWDQAGVREQLMKEGITHVVVPRDRAIRASFLEPVYRDDVYAVYRIR